MSVSFGMQHACRAVVYSPRSRTRVEKRARRLDPQALARRIVEIASDKQASDIVLLDIRQISLVADYFVVCSAASERQIAAIVRDVVDDLQDDPGIRPLRTEGRTNSGWILLDYGDVVLHVFGEEQRQFYRLEELWSDAVPLVRVQ